MFPFDDVIMQVLWRKHKHIFDNLHVSSQYPQVAETSCTNTVSPHQGGPVVVVQW